MHVSALGLHADARSRFLTSKLAGEAADARGRIAALDVTALGEALANLCMSAPSATTQAGDAAAREYDLGGPQQMTLQEQLRALRRRHTERSALYIVARQMKLPCNANDATFATPPARSNPPTPWQTACQIPD